MANLIVEIGNTALKAAVSEGINLGKTYRYQGEKKMEYIISLAEKETPSVLTVASVLPLSQSEENKLKAVCRRLIILDELHNLASTLFNLPEYLSYDRAASIIAARYLFKGKPCTIVDCGTTLTFDFIDSKGQYQGGNISIGCRTRFKAANRYAKALPLLETPKEYKETGDSISSSLESGIISGIVFEITGYIERYPDNLVLFTGGDAIYFVKRLKNTIFVVCNLVLMGIALITDEYVKKNLQ